MPVYQVPTDQIPISPAFDSAKVGAQTEREKTLDEICGNVISFEYSLREFFPGWGKVVRTKSKDRYWFAPYKKSANEFKYEDRLSQSISRSRRNLLELALCNEWKWFATFTVAADKDDRYALDVFYKRFTESFLKYLRKTSGKKIPYVLVPEKHKDGAWHLHGLFNSDIDDYLVSFAELDQTGYRSANGRRLPLKLIKGGYFDWPAYRNKFGFCSFGQIRNRIACAFYIIKYITKSLLTCNGGVLQGKQLVRSTEGLQRAVLLGRVYVNTPVLDAMITKDYEFCSTGWYQYEAEPGYNPIVDIIEQRGELAFSSDGRVFDLFGETDGNYLPISYDVEDYPPEIQAEVDAYYEATQLAIKGFEVKDGKTKVSKGSARS